MIFGGKFGADIEGASGPKATAGGISKIMSEASCATGGNGGGADISRRGLLGNKICRKSSLGYPAGKALP